MIFWDYIKGLNGKNNSNLIYSYLVWSKEQVENSADEKYRPELIVSKEQKLDKEDSTSYTSLGKILTEKGGWKFIGDNSTWNFRWDTENANNLIITNKPVDPDDALNDHLRYIYTPHYRCQFLTVMDRFLDDSSIETNHPGDKDWDYNRSIFNCHQAITKGKNERHILMLHDRIHFSSDNDGGTESKNNDGTESENNKCSADFKQCDITIENSSTFTAHCQINAESFNATSDIRAKTNIKPLLMSATNYLSNLKLYSYNYKSDNSQSIGIIAQEIEQQPVKDLNNQEILNLANAPKNDEAFYTIKQDKLVYLCIKAIQEQNEEIKMLKEEIKNLKSYFQK